MESDSRGLPEDFRKLEAVLRSEMGFKKEGPSYRSGAKASFFLYVKIVERFYARESHSNNTDFQ
jgi:hypothetical protein